MSYYWSQTFIGRMSKLTDNIINFLPPRKRIRNLYLWPQKSAEKLDLGYTVIAPLALLPRLLDHRVFQKGNTQVKDARVRKHSAIEVV